MALVNRTLTGLPLLRNAHLKLGWRQVTDEIANVLGKREVVAILWGRNAFELAGFFAPEWVIATPHPSPLSAHRGFFGSRPFSRANQILSDHGRPPINWR